MSPILNRKLLWVIFFLVEWNTFCLTLTQFSNRTAQVNKESPAIIVNEKCNEYKELRYETKTVQSPLMEKNYTVKTLRCQRITPFGVNGKLALPMEFPHMALIGYGKFIETVDWRCGGSLISKQFVLSAAKCSKSEKPQWVRLGELDLNSTTEETKSEDYKIIGEFKHPLYQNDLNYHDIILYKLGEEVKLSPFIRPICLQTSTTPLKPKTKVVIAGWGQTDTDEISDRLLKATVFIVDSKKCESSFGGTSQFKNGFNSSIAICAGDENGSDTCMGDFGGPLQVQTEVCMFTQIGIISGGSIDCGDKQTPSVYTNVAAYTDWIQPIVWPQSKSTA